MSTNFNNSENAKQLEIERALSQLGLLSKPSLPTEDSTPTKLPTASEIFEETGAGLKEAAMTIAGAMADSEKPGIQLKAAELALRVHGIFKDLDAKGMKSPQISVNIITAEGSEDKTLVQVFMPTP